MDTEPFPQDMPQEDGADAGEYADEYAREADDSPFLHPAKAARSGDAGPCLYLGPAGQRCDRRALDGGFCAVHQPGGMVRKLTNPRRVLAAALTIVALLWPYLDELVHEIIRWKHSH